ncbi:MAG: siroheme synthase [Candidatus Rokuibacteriota bacterium]|nr:MAG: siroheme synthase [Candidatus Rokubacteria bacterium]
MGYYPVLLDLAGRRCVMVGGGLVAERRVDGLLAAGAHVIVISPRLTHALAGLVAEGRVEHEPRGYRDGDLAGADLAFVATDAGEVNEAVAREARERRIWINAADDPVRCTFILPALVRRGDLTVAVATGGASPALARAIREELEAYLTDDYATLASIAAEARREVRAAGKPVTADAWRRALGPEVRRLIVERGRDDAKHRLLEILGVES